MDTYVCDSTGTKRLIIGITVCDAGGVQRTIKHAYVCDAGGTVRQIWDIFRASGGPNYSSDITSSNINPQVRFETDGTVLRRLGDNTFATTSWGSPTTTGIGSSFWIKVTSVSGTVPVSGDALNTVLSMSVERTWNITAANAGNAVDRTLAYTIYTDAAGTKAWKSGTIYLSSDRT